MDKFTDFNEREKQILVESHDRWKKLAEERGEKLDQLSWRSFGQRFLFLVATVIGSVFITVTVSFLIEVNWNRLLVDVAHCVAETTTRTVESIYAEQIRPEPGTNKPTQPAPALNHTRTYGGEMKVLPFSALETVIPIEMVPSAPVRCHLEHDRVVCEPVR